MPKLFEKFRLRYGCRWTSTYQTPSDISAGMREWSQVLDGITPDQLREGVRNWTCEWPPNPVEFRNCCVGKEDGARWEHGSQAYKPFPKPALPKRTREESKHLGMAHCRQLREILKATR